MAQDELAGSAVRNAIGLVVGRAKNSCTPLSILVGRTYVVLLAAPWLFVLLETALQSEKAASSWTIHSFFWMALSLFTFAGITVASSLIQRARRYEASCEGEQLLVANARDAMLVIQVCRNSQDALTPFSFVIKAENPAAMEKHLSAFGQETTTVGRSIDEVFPDWLKDKVRVEYTACVVSREVRRYVISQPGGLITYESIATPVLDATGTMVTHIIVTMRDVSERIQHAHGLAEALRLAEQANKSKSKFLACMSHELRTPLNAVLGYSEMLELGIGGTLSEKHKEYVQYIHQSGSHLLNIIGDILDLSKIEVGQLVLHDEEAPITPLIENCILMVKKRAAEKGLLLRTEIPSCLPVVRVDPLRFKQVILNLLSNAIKFTDQGSVTLSAFIDKTKGLMLAVSDTGIGMTQADMATALEPFGQVESALTRNHDGTGLGLPIARHLVELHGGQLSLASRIGHGTTVSVIIPPERLVDDAGILSSKQIMAS